LVVVYATAVYVGFVQQSVDLGWMYDHYVPLLTGSCLLSVTLTVYLYVSSFKPGTMLAAGTPRCRPRPRETRLAARRVCSRCGRRLSLHTCL